MDPAPSPARTEEQRLNLPQVVLKRLVWVVDAAAAIFLLVITVLTFTAVVMRYGLRMPFPGSFDVGRLLLGVAIFWGIAVAAYRREHIQVDLLWQVLPGPAKRALNLFADICFAAFMGLFSWMLLRHVQSVRASGQTTFELAIPLWPFYGVAWLGIVLCLVVLLARILETIVSPRTPPGAHS